MYKASTKQDHLSLHVMDSFVFESVTRFPQKMENDAAAISGGNRCGLKMQWGHV